MAGRKRNVRRKALDKHTGVAHTEAMLQLSGNNELTVPRLGTLGDLRKGDACVLEGIDLPSEDARRLMELGFLPGARVIAGGSAPGGDPRVFQVDGSEVALRRETARRLKIRLEPAKTPGTV
jgi:ferrous iron transport protein A